MRSRYVVGCQPSVPDAVPVTSVEDGMASATRGLATTNA